MDDISVTLCCFPGGEAEAEARPGVGLVAKRDTAAVLFNNRLYIQQSKPYAIGVARSVVTRELSKQVVCARRHTRAMVQHTDFPFFNGACGEGALDYGARGTELNGVGKQIPNDAGERFAGSVNDAWVLWTFGMNFDPRIAGQLPKLVRG